MNGENDFTKLVELIQANREWLLVRASGKVFALAANEIDIELKLNKIILGFLDAGGFHTWRVVKFERKGGEIVLDLTRSFEREKEKIRLVPRASSAELKAAVELARLARANKVARTIVRAHLGARLVRVELNADNGRFAQIVFETKSGKGIAALSDVSGGAATPENLLAFACLWLSKLAARKKKPIEIIWILADKKRAANLQNLRALLRESLQNKIEIYETARENLEARGVENQENGEENQALKRLEKIAFADLWRAAKRRKNDAPASNESSRAAREIINAAPNEIDAVFTKGGETLRFFGLPFARVRRVAGAEKVWFGVENERRILTENNLVEFANLIEELKTNRRQDAENKRGALYRFAPEAWLESILRRNVKLLDANLILSPIHSQFRFENRDRIDLLALRCDGRLVVVELKVAPDREMIFQAVDYWRKIERTRRAGNLRAAKIFGDSEIADAPALCYLAAPLLSFHPQFDFFARAVSKEIEIYRFDLNENWRENLKVARRGKVMENG